MCLTINLHWCLTLFLLFVLPGTPSGPVKEKKGGIATLSCEVEGNDIIYINLFRWSKNISVCQSEKCSGRIFKKRVCDVVIEDLRFSDAGKYILRFVYKNYPAKTYHVQIHDEVSVRIGEELKLDVLLPNADKVKTNSSGEWTEVWRRGHGVCCGRMTDRDGNLSIKEFTSNDTGTYRVLDSEGEILITVTVTESSSESDSKRTHDDKPNDSEQHTVKIVTGVLTVFGVLGVLALIIFGIKQSQSVNGGFLPVRWIRGTPEDS